MQNKKGILQVLLCLDTCCNRKTNGKPKGLWKKSLNLKS